MEAAGQGALDSLLGSIKTALVNEAQLLGGVRGNVEFIKEEIECMNSLILHLTEAQHRNHQVRTWMKQVVGLARDCDGNVELYVHYIRGRPDENLIRRTLRFLRTIRVRRRIATRIEELKVRARDVGDRRLRYGVTVPPAEPYQYRTAEELKVHAREVRERRLGYGITVPTSQDNGDQAYDEDDVQPPASPPAARDEEDLRRSYILQYTLQDDEHIVRSQPPIPLDTLWDTASMLIGGYIPEEKSSIYKFFTEVFKNDEFAAKMLLHLIYINAQMRIDDMKKYCDTIRQWKDQGNNIAKKLVMSRYRDDLPTKYKTCLLYLTIFPKGHIIRATSLARRWVAEGLISSSATTGDDTTSATDEPERYLDVLATRGFVRPAEISAAGDVKSCTVYDEFYEVIARIARDVSFVDTNLQPHLVPHLSIHNRISLQASQSDGQSINIVDFIPTMAASPQWRLLKVLDLEGSRGLNKDLLKAVCKIYLLRYLSLRNTDVTELPDQIKKLQCLETLDIRQTKVPALARKAIVLRRLKHFLAGRKVSTSNDDADRFEEMFSTVCMPLKVQKMENMEILSNVKVSQSNKELVGIGRLLKLRKFGVTLRRERATLDDLFHQVKELHRSLRSLSIRIVEQPAAGGNNDAEMVVNGTSPPEFIERLNINGLTHGLRHLIQGLPHLVKLTLGCTNVSTDDLSTIGNLFRLRSLRLQHKSYTESELVFRVQEFQSLNFLLVEGNKITNISFVHGAAPKLERIIWSFAVMDALSGINHLRKLRWLELNGNCSVDSVNREIESHRNLPVLKHIPRPQCQEAATAGVASSSSAPSAPNDSPST